MDATDVFNMNEDSHRLQAQQWLEDILEKKALYDQALQQRDLTVLDAILTRTGYENFLDILQTDWVQWGLGYWEESLYRDASESFEENGLWGLRNRQGEVVLAPQMNEIWAFNDEGIAVFERNAQYGYLNHYGKILLEAQFADAYDSFQLDGKNYAVVHPQEKPELEGLICVEDGQWVIPACYEAVEQLRYSDVFNVFKAGQYRLVNLQHQAIVAESSDHPFDLDYLNEQVKLYYCAQKGSAKRRYFLSNGSYLGEYIEDVLQPLSNGYLWVKPNKFLRKICVLKPNGELLIDDIDQLKEWSGYGYRSFAYCKNKQWSVYQTETHCFLLAQGMDKLIEGEYLHELEDIYPFEHAGQYALMHFCCDAVIL